MVPEPEEQVEEAAGGRAGGRQSEPRHGPEDRACAHLVPRQRRLRDRELRGELPERPVAPVVPAPHVLFPPHRVVRPLAQARLSPGGGLSQFFTFWKFIETWRELFGIICGFNEYTLLLLLLLLLLLVLLLLLLLLSLFLILLLFKALCSNLM